MRLDPRRRVLDGLGSFYPEEAPVRRVEIDGFWIDERPVMVAEFRWFVKATGYVMTAQRPPSAEDLPEAWIPFCAQRTTAFDIDRRPGRQRL